MKARNKAGYTLRPTRMRLLHLVLSKLIGIQVLQPFLQPLGIGLVAARIERLGVVDSRLLDENRRAGAKRECDGVARPGVDRDRLTVYFEIDEREECVVL